MMARPTKLTTALVDKARAYVKTAREHAMQLPTVEGLALELEISRETVYAWGEVEEPSSLQQQFSDIVGELKAAQANKLIQNGLAGSYNPTIAKLILSGKHGYVEKSEVDQNLSGAVAFVNDVPRPKADS